MRKIVAVGTGVVGAALITAAPAMATGHAPAPAPAGPPITPGQCVMAGGEARFFTTANSYSDGHGVCMGGQLNGRQFQDPSGASQAGL